MDKGEETNTDQADTRIMERINRSKNKEAKASNRYVNTLKNIH
jgi:hypothetical protein